MMLSLTWQRLSVSRPSIAEVPLPTISLRQAAKLSSTSPQRTDSLSWTISPVGNHVQNYHDTRRRVLFLALALLVHAGVLLFIMLPSKSLPLEKDLAPMMVSLVDLKQKTPTIKQTITPKVVPLIKPNKLTKIQPLPVVDRISEPITDQPTFQAATQESAVQETSALSTSVQKVEIQATETSKAELEEKEQAPKFGVAYLNNPEPEYPKLSRRMGEQGKVLLKVLVNASGLPVTVDVAKSSGYERLDQAAILAVKSWKFEPARKGGVPLSAYAIVPLSFMLD